MLILMSLPGKIGWHCLGFNVIYRSALYYHWVSHEQCYLVYAYAKNVAADLTKDQLLRLADVIDVEVSHG